MTPDKPPQTYNSNAPSFTHLPKTPFTLHFIPLIQLHPGLRPYSHQNKALSDFRLGEDPPISNRKLLDISNEIGIRKETQNPRRLPK